MALLQLERISAQYPGSAAPGYCALMRSSCNRAMVCPESQLAMNLALTYGA